MNNSFFSDRFGLSDSDLQKYLSAALSAGGTYADLYFEYLNSTSISVDESLVKSATQGVSAGCGVRVIAGERTGSAYTADPSPERILHAAKTAALIASGPSKQPVVDLKDKTPRSLYPVGSHSVDAEVAAKLDLVMRADRSARAADPRIFQLRAGYSDELRRILVVGSDGTYATDSQPLARFNVFCLAKDGANTSRGSAGGGGRVGIEYFQTEKTPEHFAQEAVRQAVIQLDAIEAPAGEMEVVLGPGWPGILLHEAIGHGLEGDFNRKKTSAFAGLLGQRIAAKGVTVVDDGTLPDRRGSLTIDDEGTPTQCTTLIEDGVLVGFIQDRQTGRLMGMPATGNGRRESYAHTPMPRMTNTYMLAGKDDPGEILASVKNGIYAVSF